MWALENRTRFRAERAWVRDRKGAEVWLVAVKGTFTIHPDGSTSLAEKQEDVSLVPAYRGSPGTSSLLCESDLQHTKPTTDVLLHGHAHAPRGRPVPEVDVSLEVGDTKKTLRVFGDRRWEKGLFGLRMTDPTPFVQLPLTYERAFGGIDDRPGGRERERRNPVGTGFAVDAEQALGQSLPNVEDPRALISSWEERPPPAGFGPIAASWSPRVERAGTYDERWTKERAPLLPIDFDERFYQCAPDDQQPRTHLKGGEPVELYNLTPGGLLRCSLPRVVLGFETRFRGEVVHHQGKLHSVILEPDVPRLLLVWHTSLECHPKVHKLESTTIRQKRILDRREAGA